MVLARRSDPAGLTFVPPTPVRLHPRDEHPEKSHCRIRCRSDCQRLLLRRVECLCEALDARLERRDRPRETVKVGGRERGCTARIYADGVGAAVRLLILWCRAGIRLDVGRRSWRSRPDLIPTIALGRWSVCSHPTHRAELSLLQPRPPHGSPVTRAVATVIDARAASASLLLPPSSIRIKPSIPLEPVSVPIRRPERALGRCDVRRRLASDHSGRQNGHGWLGRLALDSRQELGPISLEAGVLELPCDRPRLAWRRR